MARRLGAWDCEYCPTKRIMGDVFDCPNCGNPRSKNVRFYAIPDGPIVTPEIAEKLGSGGPNWYCEHCDSGNKDNSTKCWNCGALKGSSPSHEVKNYKEGQLPHSTEEAEQADPDGKSWVSAVPEENESDELLESDSIPLSSESIKPAGIKPYLIGGAVLLGLVLLSILIYQLFFKTHTERAQISGYRWTQSVVLEEYEVVREANWTTYPIDAYNIDSSYRDTGQDKKIHDGWITVEYQDTCYNTVSYQDTCTRSVYESETCTGTTDNGDGSFSDYSYECGSYSSESYSCTNTREEPYSCTKTREDEVYHYEDVYDWYHEYDINKWINIATNPTSGDDHKPFFEDFALNNPYVSGTPQLGQQRQFQIPGDYNITFYCSGNKKVAVDGYFTRSYPLEEWEKFKDGTDYLIEINFFKTILTYPSP